MSGPDFPVTVPLVGLTIPGFWAFLMAVAFSVIGVVVAAITDINEYPRGPARRRARAIMLGFGFLHSATVIALTAALNWNMTLAFMAGCVCLIVYGIVANQTIDTIVATIMAGQLKQAPALPLDLAALNIHRLQTTSPQHGDGGNVRLYRDKDQNILALPRGSVASSVLQHNGETLAKIIVPVTLATGRPVACRVVVLGLDTTGNPFLLELPPEYKDRSIEECERWLLHAEEGDEVVTS